MNSLTQAEADNLLAMPKMQIDGERYQYPHPGGRLNVPLKSLDKKEKFVLDITRSNIVLAKGSLQNRARRAIILARLDYGGRPHRNPDDNEIPSPHLHLYREGFGDKWAFPINIKEFPNIGNALQTLQDFMRYCNIVNQPIIKAGLFI